MLGWALAALCWRVKRTLRPHPKPEEPRFPIGSGSSYESLVSGALGAGIFRAGLRPANAGDPGLDSAADRGVGLSGHGHGPSQGHLARSDGGSAAGLGLSAAVFCLGGLGGGDVKLLAAIGAAVGPWTLLSILAWMAVAGGVLALIAAARGKRDFAYVPAIAVGVMVETLWPGGLARVLLR